MATTPAGDHKPVRVLLIDDDQEDFLLTQDLLADLPGEEYRLDWVDTYDAGLLAVCAGEYDVYLLDYRLGVRTGLELLRQAQEEGCSAPVILLTGQGEYEIDRAAMQAGAADYLEKGQLDGTILDRAIRYAILQKRSEAELERKVRERTRELELLNTNLQTEVAERRRAEEALVEADRRKDEFLATLAHELRNPLAPIRNALEIMRLADGDPAAFNRSRAVMERQVGQMVRLIDDLLDMSRISRGKIELRKERVELGRVVQHAVETSRPQIETSSHELTIDLPAEPVYVEADPARLAQVLSNLLTNSAKFTPRGGRIRLSVERQGSDAVIRVRDSGIGIAEEMLPRVFEIFSQVDRTMESAHGGLGIGLSIVRGIVELHGGSVEARSDGPGRGSEFAIRLSAILPTSPVRLAAIEGVAPEGGPARRILIVDDNRDAARSLALLLALRGHETQVAHDGIEALHAAETFRPAILFLDIGMPRLNGYAAAERLRQTDWGRALTIVALTGWGQEGDKQRSSAAGIDFHLVKPVDPDEVDRLLARIGPMDLERSESAPPH